jgi:long-chain acyl-CoA synthetase
MVAAVLPVYVGGKIIIENDLRRIRDRLQQHRPTIFFAVPALYELIYRSIEARAQTEGRLQQMRRLQALVRFIKHFLGINLGPLLFRSIHDALGGRIRFLVSGAAALKPQTASDYFSLGLPLLQGAGVSESSSAFAVQRYSRLRFLFSRYYERHLGSIGPALPGVEVRLLDVPEKAIRVADQGEGELLLRGPSVFRGYWQAPEATEAAIDDGWFRTGDLARIDKDGEIYLTGRAKYVIVLDSGEKVHPDELEAKLEDSELIEDACIVGRTERGKLIVTALIYPNIDASLAAIQASGRQPDAEAVKSLVAAEVSSLLESLADYKHVGRIELTDEPLPKTAVGKVARGRLADSCSFDVDTWLSSSERHRARVQSASKPGSS